MYIFLRKHFCILPISNPLLRISLNNNSHVEHETKELNSSNKLILNKNLPQGAFVSNYKYTEGEFNLFKLINVIHFIFSKNWL